LTGALEGPVNSNTAGVDSKAAWWVLAGCCIVALFGVSALYGSTFGLMMRPMQQELGWTRGDIAFSLTLMTLFGPAIMPLVGWVIDNVALRPLILGGVVLQSASLAAFGFMNSNVWVYYTLCLLMIVTASGASMLSLAKVLQTWFNKAFGRALGILFAVTTLGAVVHPQIVGLVIGRASWREAFMVMAVMSLVCGGLGAWFLVRQRPGALALPAASKRSARTLAQTSTQTPTQAPTQAPTAESVSMRAFLTDRVWWLLALWNMLFAFAVGAIMLHFAALMQDRGLSLAQAATAMSVIGLGGFAGNLLAGWLIDRTSATRLARAFVIAPLGAAVLLWAGSGILAAMVAAVLLGVFNAGDHSLSVFLSRRYFKPELFGRASATQQIATSFGGGISPWLAGLVHDRTGSYDMALLMSVGAFGLAVVAAWLLPEFRDGEGPTAASSQGASAAATSAAGHGA
jgi:sugar phosphate permease